MQGNLNNLVLREHFFWLWSESVQSKNFVFNVYVAFHTTLHYLISVYVWLVLTEALPWENSGVDELTTKFGLKGRGT